MAETFELAHRVGEILAAMATPADALQDEAGGLVDGEATGIAGMRAAHGEGMGGERAGLGGDLRRAQIVDAADHLALPEIGDRSRRLGAGNADRHAAAGAAAIEAEDEARPLGRAAIAM